MVVTEIRVTPTPPPTGKERIRRGMAQMALGVVETLESELETAVEMGVTGLLVGIGKHVIWPGESLIDDVVSMGKRFAKEGLYVGWHRAAYEYNRDTKRTGLPKVRWIDWVVTTVTHWEFKKGLPPRLRVDPVKHAWFHVVNPITVHGFGETARGAVDALRGR